MEQIIPTKRGYIVKVGHNMELPGIFLTELDARRAIAVHNGLKATGGIRKGRKKEDSDASISG